MAKRKLGQLNKGWKDAARKAHETAVHDRRATTYALKAEVAAIDVDDPLALNPGDKITVLRQLRNDPLARLHSHHQITDVQYMAGRRYQKDWERAEQGAQAIDPSKEAVDGGKPIDPLPERRLMASDRLNAAHEALGRNSKRLIHAFLIEEQNLERLAISTFKRHGERWFNYYGRQLRDALDVLADTYGLQTQARG